MQLGTNKRKPISIKINLRRFRLATVLLRITRKTGTVSSAPPEGLARSAPVWRRASVPFALLGSVLACFAQQSTSAGGRWIRTTEAGKDTATPVVAFVLTTNAEDPDRHPAISITCPDQSRPPVVVYNADVILAPTVLDPMNYFSPAIRAAIKVDDEKVYKAEWDIVPAPNEKEQRRVFLDRKTIHHLLTGSSMRVRFSDHYDVSYLDEFTVGGLNVNDVRETCGSKWFGKEISGTPKELAADKKVK